MNPHGRSAAMKLRSSALRFVPATPVIKAFVVMPGRLARGKAGGQGNPPLIPLDHTLTACILEVAAKLRSFLRRAEGPDHGAIINPLVAEIGALDDRRLRSQD